MTPMKAKYIKDHVSTYGKDISKATEKHYGISRSLIIKAVMGDDKALTQIGDMGKVGSRLQTAMPAIRQNLQQYIEGLTQYNVTLAELLNAGSKGSLEISKAGGDVTLENIRYQNLTEEYKTKLFANLDKESQRHDDSMDVIELNAWVDAQMTEVNAKAQLEGISNRPFIAQMKADVDYENKKMMHLLENGSDSDLDLIPQKHYTTNPVVKFWNNVREVFS